LILNFMALDLLADEVKMLRSIPEQCDESVSLS